MSSNEMSYRWTYLDSDSRRRPKTDLYCCVCQKDIKNKTGYRMVHIIEGGGKVLHPEDEKRYDDHKADVGWHPIGPDCARKLGLQWSLPVPAEGREKVQELRRIMS